MMQRTEYRQHFIMMPWRGAHGLTLIVLAFNISKYVWYELCQDAKAIIGKQKLSHCSDITTGRLHEMLQVQRIEVLRHSKSATFSFTAACLLNNFDFFPSISGCVEHFSATNNNKCMLHLLVHLIFQPFVHFSSSARRIDCSPVQSRCV